MTKVLLYIVGFLIGVFVTLNIISYRDNIYKLLSNQKEDFETQDTAVKTEETQAQSTQEPQQKSSEKPKKFEIGICNKEILDSFTIYKFLKMSDLTLLVSSFDNTHISNNTWKAHNNDTTLTFSKAVSKETFELNPYIQGANIKDVIITGIELKKNKVLNELSVLYMMKIKDFHNNFNYLFELKCKPSSAFEDKTKEKIYSENIIHILIRDNSTVELSGPSEKCMKDTECGTLQKKLHKYINLYNNYYFYDKQRMKKDDKYISNCRDDDKCKGNLAFKNELTFFEQLLDTRIYSIEIRIGKEIFNIYNISNNIFNSDITFMGLVLKNKDVTFYINNAVFTFERQSDEELLIDNEPFTINENGGCNIVLYSFACYQAAICNSDISAFKLYNNYYLYGTNKYQDTIDMLQKSNNELKTKLGM